jgi:hypothetical protein
MTSPRRKLLQGLERDLIGPQLGDDELIGVLPGDQYVSGMLHPKPHEPDAEDDEDADGADDGDGGPGEVISMSAMRRPNMMGVSFALEGVNPTIHVEGRGAFYRPCKVDDDERTDVEDPRDASHWRREPLALQADLAVGDHLSGEGAGAGLKWWVRGLQTGETDDGVPRWQVTVVLTNEAEPAPGRLEAERLTLFQVGFRVTAVGGACLVPRRSRQGGTDGDALSNALIYRKAEEWSVGHICASDWGEAGGQPYVETTWIPTTVVPAMNADGHEYFSEVSAELTGAKDGAFDAARLANADGGKALGDLLDAVPRAYGRWLNDQRGAVDEQEAAGDLSPDQVTQAKEHLETGRVVVERMDAGIALLRAKGDVREAFQLAQEAMCLQRRWSAPKRPRLVWRPFQLAFQLLTLGGVASPGVAGALSDERLTMDLLWFPTGGGKTEAYLGLTAFTLFLRRIRGREHDHGGRGVAVLMRYTLRLLTVQQFERAARLVVACDHLRRTRKGAVSLLGDEMFAIGLWVGSGATPNKLKDAESTEEQDRARQLARCPACGIKGALQWRIDRRQFDVQCTQEGCDVEGVPLGIWTIDEVVYDRRPSLVIGTIDKFAQIVRNEGTQRLFAGKPPELIIQDELHLISGPLGTVAGIYESAIDLICTGDGVAPKVVGSTATIRRAQDQVLQLFNRQVLQFPPPILDAEDSCFAVVDPEAPGRLYAGVTTSGRSPKFILQATCASLMQWAYEQPMTDEERNWYWTLVAYFNSLRELGGALVMMQDDVQDSAKNFATLRAPSGSAPNLRPLDELPLELTSRVDQADIPSYLVALEQDYPNQQYSSVLATNMISVGVDIGRLGLMVVNGQPKGMAEYIQATSRVGRGVVPGLVVTVYNAGRPRDRSHFEAFRTWHQTLYREVEATSVTPFAPRARDRALHAAVVALARHKVAGMLSAPQLTQTKRAALETLVDDLVSRAHSVDPDEAPGVRRDVSRFLDRWENRVGLKRYWNDYKPTEALLVSLETVAAAKAMSGDWRHAALGTPNSMRNVEASTKFQMWEAPMRTKPKEDGDA